MEIIDQAPIPTLCLSLAPELIVQFDGVKAGERKICQRLDGTKMGGSTVPAPSLSDLPTLGFALLQTLASGA